MSGYIGTQPVPQATQTRDSFTATSGQTSFATGGYTPNFLDVYLNGVKLASADYTATNGSDVVLASGASTGDILEVVAFTTFNSASSSIDDNGNATAITIDSNENVLVGQTTNALADTGHILDSTGTAYHIRDGASPLILNRKSSDGSIAEFYKDGTTVGSIGVYAGSLGVGQGDTGIGFFATDNIAFPSTANGVARDNAIDLGYTAGRFKDAYLSGGVYLGGTGSANKLDDVEYGTYSLADASSGNLTFTVRYGAYKKVGQLVHVEFDIDYPSTANGANAQITIPFTTNVTYFSGIVGWSNNAVPIKIHGASSGAYFMDCGNSGGGNTHLTNANLSAKRLIGSFTFCAS